MGGAYCLSLFFGFNSKMCVCVGVTIKVQKKKEMKICCFEEGDWLDFFLSNYFKRNRK